MTKEEILNKIKELEEKLNKLKSGEIKAQPNVENYTRCVGYFSRRTAVNPGKLAEIKDRIMYDIKNIK